jgi:tetratricopeptide (TPR) repeat protein
MRHIVVIFLTCFFCGGVAFAQAPVDPSDPHVFSEEMNRRLENLRAIQRWGTTMDAPTMRATLFTPMPSEVAAYSKIPHKARAHFERGNEALQRGELQKAQEEFESAIAAHPAFALAHHNLAVVAMSLDQLPRAREELQAAIKNDPQLPAAHQNLGVLEIKERRFNAAVVPLQNANRLDPKDLKTLTLLAFCQAVTHQLGEAVLTARRVHDFKNHAGYAYSHMIAATALQSLGRKDDAIREYKQFISEDPKDPRTAAAKQQLQILQPVQ